MSMLCYAMVYIAKDMLEQTVVLSWDTVAMYFLNDVDAIFSGCFYPSHFPINAFIAFVPDNDVLAFSLANMYCVYINFRRHQFSRIL